MPSAAGDPVIITDVDGCILVCDSTIVRYYAHGVFGSAFTWALSGGIIINDYGDSIDVYWPTPGITGSITLFDSFSHCIGQATACIKVIEKPHAYFTASSLTICKGDEIHFFDHSTSDSLSSLVSWFWDFGDGFASTTENASHIFSWNLCRNAHCQE